MIPRCATGDDRKRQQGCHTQKKTRYRAYEQEARVKVSCQRVISWAKLSALRRLSKKIPKGTTMRLTVTLILASLFALPCVAQENAATPEAPAQTSGEAKP